MQIFDSYIEAGQNMKPRDRERFYTAVIEYLYYGKKPSVNGEPKSVLTAIWPTLEESRKKVVNGRKGGRGNKAGGENAESKMPDSEKAKPVNPGKLDGENPESKTPDSGKTKGNSKGNKKEINKFISKEEALAFQKPTVEDVRTHCDEMGYTFDPEEFVATYEATGWMAGKSPIVDWMAKCVSWQKRERPPARSPDPVLPPAVMKCPTCGETSWPIGNGRHECPRCGEWSQ